MKFLPFKVAVKQQERPHRDFMESISKKNENNAIYRLEAIQQRLISISELAH